MKRFLTILALVGMCGEQAGANELYERFKYQHNGCWYWGYRPYSAPAQSKAEYKNEHHAENYSRVYHQEYHFYEPSAKAGNSVYGLSSFDASGYGAPVRNTSAYLAEKFIEASHKTASDAGSFDQLALNTQSVVLREVVANQRLQLLASATEVRAGAAVHSGGHSSPAPSVGGTLAATEQACLSCHAANVAESKGNSNVLSSLATLNAESADIALEYVTRTDANNCAKKANLSPEAQKELVKFLCKKSNQ